MHFLIPVYITNNNSIEIIIDQLYVAIESFYQQGNKGTFIIYTNSPEVEIAIKLYRDSYNRDVVIEIIDFEKIWDSLNLPINSCRTRREFIISKMILPFIFDESYVTFDWDIMTTGYIDPIHLVSDKLRLYNPKFFDGVNLRQNSISMGLHPDDEMVGRFRWLNSGMISTPKGLAKELILEYWDLFNNTTEPLYKGIHLFDIIGDELIYNLMKLNGDPRVVEYMEGNINTVFRNYFYNYENVKSMFDFGKMHPNLLSVHFAVGHIKPFDIIVDENYGLHIKMSFEDRFNTNSGLRWMFDIGQHRLGSFHYNAIMFSIIWQYMRYSIREKLGLTKDNISSRYASFFNKSFVC